MKPFLFAITLILLGSGAAHAQFTFGVKGGLNTQVNKPGGLNVNLMDTAYVLGLGDAKFGQQIGAYVRIGKGFWIQPEVMFNSNQQSFTLDSPLGQVVKNEKYQYLDLPVMLGVGSGFLKFQAGAVGHYFLNSTSELKEFNEYRAKFRQFTWGWQAGLNIGFDKFAIDLRYEGNFSNLGEHIYIDGQQYKFDKSPARVLASVQVGLY